MKTYLSFSGRSWAEIPVVNGNLVVMPRYGTFDDLPKRKRPGDIVSIGKKAGRRRAFRKKS